MRIDAHTHSLVSDGTDTPNWLVVEARNAGLDVIALTDHDTQAGLDAARAGAPAGLRVAGGAELSCTYSGREVHLLAYGIRPNLELDTELERVRASRRTRIDQICARLTELGFPLRAEEVFEAGGGAVSVGRPHVADAMIKKGYVTDRGEAFALWLAPGRPGFVGRYYLPLDRAIKLVRDAGGVAVLAHPWGRGNRGVLTESVLRSCTGLDGIEVDHQNHDAAARVQLRQIAEALNLIATGGSDYHGLGKRDHDLGCNTTTVTSWNAIEARVAARGGSLYGE